MAATSPSPTVNEYGAFTQGAQTQLESVFLLKEFRYTGADGFG